MTISWSRLRQHLRDQAEREIADERAAEGRCPACGADGRGRRGPASPGHRDGRMAVSFPADCADCGAGWVETYHLANVIVTRREGSHATP